MGAATARLLAEGGANVALIGRREEPLQRTADEIIAAGGQALVVPADVSKAEAMQAAVTRTVAEFGALHLAVNNAGVNGKFTPVGELDPAEWDATISINLSGTFYAMRYEIPEILKAGGGAIVNVSSVQADRGLARCADYAASKHALRGLTRSAAIEYARQGIRINELQPGVIATDLLIGHEEQVAQAVERIPSQTVGTSEEVAAAICFLLSDEASYITGAHLAIDGGVLA
jgi:NAD(P)-dependent dehydrogenase (short-subunit alcohol dehydrogenase family)